MEHALNEVAATEPRQPRLEMVNPTTFTQDMEQLQQGYITSVAASAGCNLEIIGKDNYGVDVRIVRPPRTHVEEEHMLNVQLKATTQIIPDPDKGHFSYQFEDRKHFERLAAVRSYPKRILVVMTLPPRQLEWTKADHPGLLTRRCCYWVNLEKKEARPGVSKPWVRIPMSNIFDVDALIEILKRSDAGEPLNG